MRNCSRAIAGQSTAVLVCAWWMDLQIPLLPLLLGIGVLAVFAVFAAWRLAQPWPLREWEAVCHIAFDTLVLGYLLYFTGGASNPFITLLLVPIALAAVVPLALVVPSKASYSTLSDFLTALKAKPKITFASAGIGTPGHFAGELLKLKFDENLTHVPYKGAGPALNDLIGGHVEFYFSGFPAAAPHVKAGNLKLLALSSAKRSPAVPDVPTVAEVTGINDYDFTLWAGFFAPRGTPQPVIDRLNKEINGVLAQPDVKARLEAAGAVVTAMSVAEFKSFVHGESAKYLNVIKETGVTSQ